jgi:hypothetical protein
MKRLKAAKSVPYAGARAGDAARNEITKILRGFGCESMAFADDFAKGDVVLAFEHRGRHVQLRASSRGWAQLYLKQNPWSYRHRTPRQEYEQAAVRQGYIAVSSILRDWIKGQVTAVETGILSFEAVFLPHMLTGDGRPLIERLPETKLLPESAPAKVVNIT